MFFGRILLSRDRDGAITETSDVRPRDDAVAAALGAFVGEIEQVPPAFSAIKVDGERAYDLARAGVEFDLAARAVTIACARGRRVTTSAAPQASIMEIPMVGMYV